MNPIVFELGPYSLHLGPLSYETGALVLRAYTAWLVAGILAGLALIAWRGARVQGTRRAALRWLDVALAGLVAGIVGARALHVLLEWDYFQTHRDAITALDSGGMTWHGGLAAGALAVWGAARLRDVPLRAWTDAFALAFPLGMIGAWSGCREAGCGYGYEVATLADWPGWMVAELPDVFGLFAPRLDLHSAGVLFGALLFALALLLTAFGWLRGLRLWPVLALAGLGLALAGFFRADPAQMVADRRVDQLLNLLLLLASTVTGCALWLADHPPASDDIPPAPVPDNGPDRDP